MAEKRKHPKDVRTFRKETPATTQRKLAKDGNTWTPTEQRKRDKALKQFCKFGRKGVGVSSGNSEEYKAGYDAIDWSKG